MNSPITFSHVSYAWPDGGLALKDLSVTFSTGRTGLIGDNGSGKTTLLRLIAGHLRPTSGDLCLVGDVVYLPQSITTMGVDPHSSMVDGAGSGWTPSTQGVSTVADLLGIADKVAALRAIECGSYDERHYETLGDDWDIEIQAEQVLRGLDTAGGALQGIDLARPTATLSGGEAMVVAIAGCRLRHAAITLLDEPTNNLDEVLRAHVIQMMRQWPGTVLVVSHDTILLEEMDAIAELYDGDVTVFGGAYSQWRQAYERDQAAAVQAEKAAAQAVKVARHQRIAAVERSQKNLARGKAKAIGEGLGKAARQAMRNRSEETAGRVKDVGDDRLEAARTALDEAARRVRDDDRILIDLPDPHVHASKQLVELTWGDDERYLIQGPERVGLTGRNGAGKTTLIEQMLSGRAAGGSMSGHAPVRERTPERPSVVGRLLTNRVGYLPQRFDILDDKATAIQNVALVAPDAREAEIRSRLARLLLRGEAVFRPVGDLSGGERFRVALARLLFATPPAQVLILDEPTNNLDMTSVDQLVEALEAYRGAILVVSHDPAFLSRIHVDVRLDLCDGRIVRL